MAYGNVYIVGSQGTGKTTLPNALEVYYALKNVDEAVRQPFIIQEVARQVVEKSGITREHMASASRAFQLQKSILNAQWEAEATTGSDASCSWYISDRPGVDPIVYAQLFAGDAAAKVMTESPAWGELEPRMKTGVVMLCEVECI